MKIPKDRAIAIVMTGFCLVAWSFNTCAAARTNLALNKTATADSYDATGGPQMAVDGKLGQNSRWENNYAPKPDSLKGNAWIYVDLGAKYLVDSVAIYWEH